MGKNQNTMEKRRREIEKKQRVDDKKKKRLARKDDDGAVDADAEYTRRMEEERMRD